MAKNHCASRKLIWLPQGEIGDGQVGQKLDNVSLKHSKEGCKLEHVGTILQSDLFKMYSVKCSTVIY